MQRRALLVSLSTGVTAGCVGIFDALEATLGHFDVMNYDDEPHVFRVRIERDGSTVHRFSRRVEHDDPIAIRAADRTWGTTPGRYTLSLSVGSAHTHATFTKRGCHDVILDYRSGNVGIFSHNDGPRCR
ncbi:hypothetical protein V5735_03075 (plasmid) [Haladaptatus sp. SPP-AMP-3]|uniref:hypothetical protein n=1 Tax=Haladaptatus sp. SPP-AMP-3 TaxID=3121295 RepID=UPI003C2FCCF0